MNNDFKFIGFSSYCFKIVVFKTIFFAKF